MVALCSGRISQRALVEEWRAITGDSFILDVRPFSRFQEPAVAFLEVCKYAVKFSEMEPERTLEAFEVLRGRRLIFSLGAFRGVEVPTELLDEPLDGLPYIELFYRYLEACGYEFTPGGVDALRAAPRGLSAGTAHPGADEPAPSAVHACPACRGPT
jgi:hypothetical protein